MRAALAAGLLLLAAVRPAAAQQTAAPPAAAGTEAAAPAVTAVEIASPHVIPEGQVREAIGPLAGRPRLRGAVRDSVARVWQLGLFEAVRVEERPEPGGVRLVYHLRRRPHLREVAFRGDVELPGVDVAEVLALGPGDPADPARLEQARRALLERYRREGYLAARVDVESRTDEATNARDVVFAIEAGERARIGRLSITGAPDEILTTVRRALGLREGEPYRERAVRDGVDAAGQRLREQGHYEARVTSEPPQWNQRENRVDLTIQVTPGPRFRVEFQGNRALRDRALRESLTFAGAGAVDESEVRASARQLAAAYREQGHHFAQVTGTLARDADGPVVRFAIEEGPRVLVESVEIEGPTTLSHQTLLAQILTAPSGWLRRSPFSEEALQADVRALEGYLQAQGFPDARVGPARVDFSPDRTRARVVIPVAEGSRVRVGQVRVEGAALFPAAELVAALPFRTGDPWSQARAEEGRRVLERRYARRGYLGAEVAVDSRRRDDTADVVYRVAEGGQTRVGRVIVRGLLFTRDEVVRRELPFREGEPFDPEQLVEGQRRLIALGLFESVDVEPLRPRPIPVADVTVTVREGRPWHVDLGVGYSTFEGFRGFVEAGHDNLFGTGRSLALRLRASERNERAELIYRSPWLFGSRFTFESSVFYERLDEIGFDLDRYGITAGAHRDLGDFLPGLRGFLGYRIAQVDRYNVDATLAPDVHEGSQVVAVATQELTLDRRDHPLDPRRGHYHLVALDTGGVVLGGDADFVRGRFETLWLLDGLRPVVVALAGRLGLAAPLLDSDELPIEERFFAGGAATVRGYRERRVGPLDDRGNPIGGNALVVLNAELRFPIWRWVYGAVFVDTGAVTPEIDDLAPDQFRTGVGAGIRISTPVGPLRFDMGYPLDRLPTEEQKLRFYLTVGYPF